MFLIRIAAFIIVGFIIWCVIKPRHAIRIIAGPDGVTKSDGISQVQYSKLAAFFRDSMALDTEVTVLANRNLRGSLRVQMRGTRDPGIVQQIRNFLQLTL